MIRYRLTFSIVILFAVASCSTGPRHSSYAPVVSVYQKIMSSCPEGKKDLCSKRYEYLYGTSNNEHRLLEYHNIMSQCTDEKKYECQNRYDNMLVF